ncbi:MAG: FMN-binding protein [Candidatus Thiodiazotropha sp.]|nr:FMN-binding protein [Candidatus Thiodiazotropha sp. (ex Lucina pensylvanica)]PUB72621.1 MAG: FMN-binding protein [gamma proteobacterium symbiont of Ctena orbiculata]
MSTPEAEALPPATPAGKMIQTLVGIAMLSGFLVVLTYQLTKPIIAENQRRAIEAAVFTVIPDAVVRSDFVINDKGLTPVTGEESVEGVLIYAGYNRDGELKGIAAKAAAQGYADLIHLLYGYDPGCECIRGMKVLKLAETPGLGDKIITDANFVANFEALDARLNTDGSALANEIVTVKAGSKQNPWEIDAISGATISSKAVGKAINQSAKQLLPAIRPHLEKLKQPPVLPDQQEVADD